MSVQLRGARHGWGRPVHVVGAGAVCGRGVGWRGLAARTAEGDATTPASMATTATTVPALSAAEEPCERRQLKLMSRAAYLGAAAVKAALIDAAWHLPAGGGLDVGPGLDIGLFMGVGASGGEMGELEAMLAASVDARGLDLGRLGTTGLGAANPLYAFQLMNNFTLCHGAILAGLEGPNAAFYSRGAGTVMALREAAFAVADGDTPRALAGGADSALHPVTLSELARGGWTARGLAPAEGAALVALTSESGLGRPRLERAEVWHPRDGDALPELVARALGAEPTPGVPTVLVLAGWGPATGAALRQATDHPGSSLSSSALAGLSSSSSRPPEVIDATAALGEALAATPALAWCLALDWLAASTRGRAVVLSAGIDGDLGLVTFGKEPA